MQWKVNYYHPRKILLLSELGCSGGGTTQSPSGFCRRCYYLLVQASCTSIGLVLSFWPLLGSGTVLNLLLGCWLQEIHQKLFLYFTNSLGIYS
uniref:Uncharacterized protein n=1 Tax=Rhizophora mucronata TaxID=61149 RepID=A0A2P2K161_RHIMU